MEEVAPGVYSGTGEEMQKFLADNEARAQEWIAPISRTITFGSYLVSLSGLKQVGFAWGYASTLEEKEQWLRENVSADEVEEVIAYERDIHETGLKHGHIQADWHSYPFPEGELSDAHLSYCIPVSKEAFEEARSLNWRVYDHGGVSGWLCSPELQAELRDTLTVHKLQQLGILTG